PDQLRQDAGDSATIHFLVQLLAVVLGTRSKGHTTGTPDRAADGAGTCTAGAFLTPWFASAAADFGTGLLLNGTLSGACQIGDHSLMHQRFIELTSECCIRDGNFFFTRYITGFCNTQFHCLPLGRSSFD